MPARRFPLPWSIEEQAACFIVGDLSGQALAYVYFENEPGRRRDVTRREPTSRIGALRNGPTEAWRNQPNVACEFRD
jgi:hypothetical protein